MRSAWRAWTGWPGTSRSGGCTSACSPCWRWNPSRSTRACSGRRRGGNCVQIRLAMPYREELDMSDELPVREGFLPFAGHQTWYRITGESEQPGKFPLLCLHGGPGATWHHMEPYQELAADGRRVICYDQLGCGNSVISAPHDLAMWTLELFRSEVTAVREQLGLDQCHLLG